MMKGADVKQWIAWRISLVVLVALLGGCGGGSEEASPAATDESATGEPSGESRSARTLAVPGAELPPDHPPLQDAAASRLAWEVPQDWSVEQPATRMRIAQYRVPGPSGDGECIVFYFGPGQGGDAMSNARRWAGQFTQPDGSSSLDRMEVSSLDSALVPVEVVEVSGTYDGGMTMTAQPAEQREGYMLLGAIAEGPDGPWFFKLTGPEPTIRAQREAFMGMMRSIRLEM
jgi:hypothetical protein